MTGTHCKNVSHLHVGTVPYDAAEAGPGETTAELVEKCECANDPSYTGSCVVIGHRERHPEFGMHLFPDAARWVSDELRALAISNPKDGIALSHTVLGTFKVWRVFTPDGATDLANRIDEVLPA